MKLLEEIETVNNESLQVTKSNFFGILELNTAIFYLQDNNGNIFTLANNVDLEYGELLIDLIDQLDDNVDINLLIRIFNLQEQ
jgi:hypothetical protein